MWLSAAGIAVLLAGMAGLHRRSPHHRLLSFGGTAILAWLMGLWLFLV